MIERNSIINGDCLEVMKDIEDRSIDMILCDLPYGTTQCSWDTIIPFEPLWEQYKRIIKKNGAIVLFGSEPFSSKLRMSNLNWFKYDWYWEKDKGANFIFSNLQPLKIIETISVFYKNQPIYNPQKTLNPKGVSTKHLYKNPAKITKNMKYVMGGLWKESDMASTQNCFGNKYEPDKLLPRSLIYFSKLQRGKVHPTQKPVELCEYLIKTYTNEGGLVLDNCCGSGTTGLAAINTNRDYILIEKDENYFNIANNRLNEAITSKNGLEF